MTDISEKLRAQLIRDEGRVAHVYTDSLGFLTIGVGCLVDARKGGKLCDAAIDVQLDYDIKTHTDALLVAFPWVADLDPVRQAVLVSMAFNLGIDGLSKFAQTLACVHSADYNGAAERMLDSLWAKQVGIRATRLAEQMRSGIWQ